MVKAARKYNRVTQVGTQQRSMPINNWASDLVKNGALGKILTVIAPNFVGPERWTDQPAEPMPDGGSDNWWDVWTNQAVLRPYHKSIHHGWDRWWDYDGGGRCFGVTGWGTHSYDQINRALGTDDTGPGRDPAGRAGQGEGHRQVRPEVAVGRSRSPTKTPARIITAWRSSAARGPRSR